jgi:hypothetical protein
MSIALRYQAEDVLCLPLTVDRLLEMLGMPDLGSFRTEYQERILRAIEAKRLNRERCWTESIAVGGKEYVTRIAATIRDERLRPRIEEGENGSWAVWESSSDHRVMQATAQPAQCPNFP